MTVSPARMRKRLIDHCMWCDKVLRRVSHLRQLVNAAERTPSALNGERVRVADRNLSKLLEEWSKTTLVIEPGGAALLLRRTVRRSRIDASEGRKK